MKTTFTTFVTLLWFCMATAQENSKAVIKPAITSTANNKAITDCKQISGGNVETTLLNGAFRTFDLKLDEKEGFLKIGNKRSAFRIAEYKINKPGHNWVYSVNDINSFKHFLKAEKNNFYLYIEFEGNGNEIKGECPGCAKAFKDRRAPDINWKGARVARIKLKPVSFQNSISFQVQEVELEGKFDINGPVDIFMPTVNFLELAIKKAIESQMKKYLNNAVVKKQIADAFKPVVEKTGFNKIQNVYMLNGQLFICGAIVQKVNIK
jgi:hypothetical protein